MNWLEWPQHFSHYKYENFLFAQGQLTRKPLVRSGLDSKLCPDFIVGLVTWKIEEDPIKDGGAKVATRFSPL